MLSDDITGTVGKTASLTGSALGGAFRGLFMGAALTALVLFAWPVVPALFAAGSALAGGATLTAATAGLVGTATTTGALAIGAAAVTKAALISGAVAGSAVLGITSVIPGVSEGFGLKRLFATRRSQTVEISNDRDPAVTIQQPLTVHVPAPTRPQVTVDNYHFEEGRGAAMLQRGNDAAPTICRSTT